jgi:hypothetical protein
MTILEILNQYGFALDKIRRLDNDLIRIKSKLNTILTIREEQR